MKRKLIKKAFDLSEEIFKEINVKEINRKSYLDKNNFCKYYDGICFPYKNSCEKCKYFKGELK